MELKLKNKAVLITGASKGIGLAVAEVFAAEGCHLHLAARNGEAMAEAKREIEARHGVEVRIHELDLSTTAAMAPSSETCASPFAFTTADGSCPASAPTST